MNENPLSEGHLLELEAALSEMQACHAGEAEKVNALQAENKRLEVHHGKALMENERLRAKYEEVLVCLSDEVKAHQEKAEENERLRADLQKWPEAVVDSRYLRKENERLKACVVYLEGEVDALSDKPAKAAIQRVRGRHQKMTHTRGDGSSYDFCSECLDYLTYPCATIKDLDGRETIPTEKEPT